MKKPKAKGRGIKLNYKMRAILKASAIEFTFSEKFSIVAIHVPTVGMLVVGKAAANPSRCWTYPPDTSFKNAISKTFDQILDMADKQLKDHKECL